MAAAVAAARGPMRERSAKTSAGQGPSWISARHLRHMVARGDAAGVRVDALLAGAGLDRARLEDAEGLVPLAAVEAMLASLAGRAGDDLLGLRLARDVPPATFGALGHLLQTCSRFGDVLDAVVRYDGLLSNVGASAVRRGPDGVELAWECRAGSDAFRRHATEYVLGAFVVLARRLLPERRDLLRRIRFAHPPPRDPLLVEEVAAFFGCPVDYDEAASAVVLGPGVPEARLRHGDAFLKDVLERHAASVLRRRDHSPPVTAAVRRALEASILDGGPSKDRVAAQLGVSGRSLHRRLMESGTSYRSLLDAVRLEMATERLRTGGDPIEAIALQLGFRSHQAFLRWFKQRIGTTPGAYRKRERGDAESPSPPRARA